MRWLVSLVFLAAVGCAPMTPEQKTKIDVLNAQLGQLQNDLRVVTQRVESGELTVNEGIEATRKIYAQIQDVRRATDAVKASGVKWYHVAWGILSALLGGGTLQSLLRGAVLRRVVRGVEKGGNADTKKAIAREAAKGPTGGIISTLLSGWVAKLT